MPLATFTPPCPPRPPARTHLLRGGPSHPFSPVTPTPPTRPWHPYWTHYPGPSRGRWLAVTPPPTCLPSRPSSGRSPVSQGGLAHPVAPVDRLDPVQVGNWNLCRQQRRRWGRWRWGWGRKWGQWRRRREAVDGPCHGPRRGPSLVGDQEGGRALWTDPMPTPSPSLVNAAVARGLEAHHRDQEAHGLGRAVRLLIV